MAIIKAEKVRGMIVVNIYFCYIYCYIFTQIGEKIEMLNFQNSFYFQKKIFSQKFGRVLTTSDKKWSRRTLA